MKNLFALELAINFYKLSQSIKMPKHLKDQFDRAASSIALNLTEGASRPTRADRRRFYFMALGSARECRTILTLNETTPAELINQSDFLSATVCRLCQSMK